MWIVPSVDRLPATFTILPKEAGKAMFKRLRGYFSSDLSIDLGTANTLIYKRGIGLGPNHDWSSHGADSFGLMCIAHEEPTVKREPVRKPAFAGGWMG